MSPQTDGIEHGPLEDWFRERVAELEPPLDYEKIHGGMSNLTYLVTDQGGSRWVLRRPPLGKVLGSAHDMGREVRVVRALAGTGVPVPPVVGYCEDEAVTGAPFYVMEFVEGPVIRGPEQAAAFPSEEQRRRLGEGLVETMAKIHSVDVNEVGLSDLGRHDGYVQRQLKRWSGQWEKSKTRELPLVEDVHSRLVELAPPQSAVTLVHGDYRLDNVIYSPTGEVAAVVDWELCTIGEPLADLGLLMVYWREAGDEQIPLITPATVEPGFPTRAELADLYAEINGRDISKLDYFVALGFWKLAIIAEGVLARFAAGQYGDDIGDVVERSQATIDLLVGQADEAINRIA
ncbi:MAG TPA: phosphotransferase family protein [Solirubrobacterales bacterium]|nr:phosphotransferase family protein [Solirubrobacterales bacterium]HMU26588.1 phosphotransferase family protein [Solirubrobacterales bacterium]HMX72145.1 phosphotransferase family protein [Solirubrobacterales bacterium]HMY25189.1 phosphotransferase family protein [Solirubrobacterales bacterium]HNA24120.1 phosphotransferase family protein [Solirubrobacterales bacterium]